MHNPKRSGGNNSNFCEGYLEPPLVKKTSNINLLIVDDDQINLIVASNYLQSAKDKNFIFQTANNGKIALDLVRSNAIIGRPFDIILMDSKMPVIEGFEAAKTLKADMRKGLLPQAPIIAVKF